MLGQHSRLRGGRCMYVDVYVYAYVYDMLMHMYIYYPLYLYSYMFYIYSPFNAIPRLERDPKPPMPLLSLAVEELVYLWLLQVALGHPGQKSCEGGQSRGRVVLFH